MDDDLLYLIALNSVQGVGSVLAKSLVSYCGSASAVFKTRTGLLQKIPGIGFKTSMELRASDTLGRAEKELKFIEKNEIRAFPYYAAEYPSRLKQCADSPILLFFRGKWSGEWPRALSIVGTRRASLYGKKLCKSLVEVFADKGIHIISGLAYGIDIEAHQACIQNGVPTVGVLAHGLDKIYPFAHRSVALKMLEEGGLVTEFPSETRPDKQNFPRRNRIIAGLADATLVVESGLKGGAIITAGIASSYNRDVFAMPGPVNSVQSEGCNWMIRSNQAILARSAEDILQDLGWDTEKAQPQKQRPLFVDLEGDELVVYNYLSEKGDCGIDHLSASLEMNRSRLVSSLLNLEFKSLVAAVPGNRYKLM